MNYATTTSPNTESLTARLAATATRLWRRYLHWVGYYTDSPNPLNPEA